MKKQVIVILSLVLLVAITLGAYLFVRNNNQEKQKKERRKNSLKCFKTGNSYRFLIFFILASFLMLGEPSAFSCKPQISPRSSPAALQWYGLTF